MLLVIYLYNYRQKSSPVCRYSAKYYILHAISNIGSEPKPKPSSGENSNFKVYPVCCSIVKPVDFEISVAET